MMTKVMPIEDTISCDCDCWVKVGSGNVNHEGLNEVLDFIEKYLPDHSDRENIDLFLLRYKEEHHTAIPEFSILLAHHHFEHPRSAHDVQLLATMLRMMELEICEHLGGYAELKYLNTHREKMIIELTGITDYDLIQEIVENGGGWQTHNYGSDDLDIYDEGNSYCASCCQKRVNEINAEIQKFKHTAYIEVGGFLGLLTVLFIGLKLTGHIDWSWLWVLAPLWIPLGLLLLTLIVLFELWLQ